MRDGIIVSNFFLDWGDWISTKDFPIHLLFSTKYSCPTPPKETIHSKKMGRGRVLRRVNHEGGSLIYQGGGILDYQGAGSCSLRKERKLVYKWGGKLVYQEEGSCFTKRREAGLPRVKKPVYKGGGKLVKQG